MFAKRLIFSLSILILVFALVGIGIGYFISTLQTLPRVEQLVNFHPNQITTIYSDDGEVLEEFFIERRKVIALPEIPIYLQEAFIAVEDHRFYKHPGIDIIRLTGSLWTSLVSWSKPRGTSTITQQLARNLFLTYEQTISRKTKEIILAIEIEKKYSKDEILKMYLNQIYFGHGVYGVAEATSFYFDKQIEELTLAESALLASIPKSPGDYSPFYNPENTFKRRNHVLQRMHEVGFINEDQKIKTQQSPLAVVTDTEREGKKHIHQAPYFAEWVRQIVARKYGYEMLWKGGLKIYTTLNAKMQKAAEEALLPYLEKNNFQGALLAMDPHTGFIKAMVGGRDFQESQFNRATQAHRQTGSAFKIFTYTAAIDTKKFNAVSRFFDSPIIFYTGRKPIGNNEEKSWFWSPQNYEKYYWGEVYLWEMLAHSINVASVKLLQEIGVGTVIRYAKKMGVESPLNSDLTLTLGTSGISLLEMVKGYGTIANYGIKIVPIFIKRIENSQGEVLEENFPQGESVLSPQTAFMMIDLLKKTVDRGTGQKIRWLEFDRPCAGKTGTVGWPGAKETDKTMDAWFIGFTPDLVAGVWVGKDDGSPLGEKITGSAAAIPAWTEFMKKSLEGKPVKDFPCPSGIIFKKINLDTGFLAQQEDENNEWFAFREENTSQLHFPQKNKDQQLLKDFNLSRFFPTNLN